MYFLFWGELPLLREDAHWHLALKSQLVISVFVLFLSCNYSVELMSILINSHAFLLLLLLLMTPLPLCRMCPIFQISNVTGENMDLLKMFLNLLSSRTNFNNDEPAEFQIDDTYSVPVWNKTHTRTLSCALVNVKYFISFFLHSLTSFWFPCFSHWRTREWTRPNRIVDSGLSVEVWPWGGTTVKSLCCCRLRLI